MPVKESITSVPLVNECILNSLYPVDKYVNIFSLHLFNFTVKQKIHQSNFNNFKYVDMTASKCKTILQERYNNLQVTATAMKRIYKTG